MDWMNNLFVILTLTTVTGSIFYLIGLVFEKIWAKNDIKVLRLHMRITQWAYLIPCVYIILYVQERRRMSTAGGSINLFYNTPAMQKAFAVLGFVWICLFMALIAHKLYMRCQRMRVFDGNIPEEDVETRAMFEKICDQLGIAGKVSLYRNDLIRIPYMTYWHGYAVVIPLERYTREETAVILYHELCHYLNRDLYVGTVSCIVSLLHVINPFVPMMLRQLSLACEEYCDRRACQEGVEEFNEKEYFRTILKVVSEEEKRERYDLFALADSICEYEKRVLCMRRYHEHGGIKNRTAVVLLICFLFWSSMMAFGTGKGMTEVYAKAAEATDIRAADNEEEDFKKTSVVINGEGVLKEFSGICNLDTDDLIMMGEEGIEPIGAFVGVDWALSPGKTGMMSAFFKEANSIVSIMTVGDPDDIRYQMGIKDSNEHIRYVEGDGHLSYDFLISKKGNYYFFVTNLDNTRELQIKGTVIK